MLQRQPTLAICWGLRGAPPAPAPDPPHTELLAAGTQTDLTLVLSGDIPRLSAFWGEQFAKTPTQRRPGRKSEKIDGLAVRGQAEKPLIAERQPSLASDIRSQAYSTIVDGLTESVRLAGSAGLVATSQPLSDQAQGMSGIVTSTPASGEPQDQRRPPVRHSTTTMLRLAISSCESGVKSQEALRKSVTQKSILPHHLEAQWSTAILIPPKNITPGSSGSYATPIPTKRNDANQRRRLTVAGGAAIAEGRQPPVAPQRRRATVADPQQRLPRWSTPMPKPRNSGAANAKQGTKGGLPPKAAAIQRGVAPTVAIPEEASSTITDNQITAAQKALRFKSDSKKSNPMKAVSRRAEAARSADGDANLIRSGDDHPYRSEGDQENSRHTVDLNGRSSGRRKEDCGKSQTMVCEVVAQTACERCLDEEGCVLSQEDPCTAELASASTIEHGLSRQLIDSPEILPGSSIAKGEPVGLEDVSFEPGEGSASVVLASARNTRSAELGSAGCASLVIPAAPLRGHQPPSDTEGSDKVQQPRKRGRHNESRHHNAHATKKSRHLVS